MKTLYLTVASDDYVPGVIALIKSIKKHHPYFNLDFKIIYHDKYCPLKDKSKNELLKVYNKFIFQKVTLEEFKVNNLKIKHPRFNYACLLSFFAFNQNLYDKVVFLDSDLIFLKKFRYIEKINADFIGTKDSINKYKSNCVIKKDKGININVGLFIVNKKYNNKKTFDDLINLMNEKRRVKLPDQEIINSYFDGRDIYLLPLEYNRQVREFYTNDKYNNLKKNDDVCLHFCGPKPWLGGIAKTSLAEKIWWEYYKL